MSEQGIYEVFDMDKIININNRLRLQVPKKSEWAKALDWYSDKDILYYSEGVTDKVYTINEIKAMYSYLSKIGTLYFIEVKENDDWLSIGDATFSEQTLPIVIGDKRCWGKGSGKSVISTFIQLARQRGIGILKLKEIYAYNLRSIRLFTSLGFVALRDGTYTLNL